jgi:hypothetical protein
MKFAIANMLALILLILILCMTEALSNAYKECIEKTIAATNTTIK